MYYSSVYRFCQFCNAKKVSFFENIPGRKRLQFMFCEYFRRKKQVNISLKGTKTPWLFHGVLSLAA